MSIDQPPGTRKRNNDPRETPLAPKSPAEKWKLAQSIDENPSGPQTPRIYKDLAHDPDVLEVHERVTKLSEAASSDEERALIYNQQWGAFEKTHPEKALAYRQTTENQVEPAQFYEEPAQIEYEHVAEIPEINPFEEAQSLDEEKAAIEHEGYLTKEAAQKAKDQRKINKVLKNLKKLEWDQVPEMSEELDAEDQDEKRHIRYEDVEARPEIDPFDEKIELAKEKAEAEFKEYQESRPSEKKENAFERTFSKENLAKISKPAKVATAALGTAALAGVGLWAGSSILSALGAAPEAASLISATGLWGVAGAGVGMVIMDIFYWQLAKNLLVDGYKWISGSVGKMMGGSSGGGHSAAPKKAAAPAHH